MSVYLVRRVTKKGIRWHVRAELNDPDLGVRKLVKKKDGSTVVETRLVIHLGVFETKELATIRREAALREIAEGRPPKRFIVSAPTSKVTVKDAAETWRGTLHNLAETTLEYYVRSSKNYPDWLANADPESLNHTHIQRYVAEVSSKWKRGTINRELAVLRMILDNYGVKANPVGDKRVRLPKSGPKRMRLPSKADIALLHKALPTRVELLTLLEHTGLRIHEAAALRWEDIDYERDRLLVRASKTAAGRRWVTRLPTAQEYPKHGAIERGLVFSNPSPNSLTDALRSIHLNHGIPLYSAHDFRHLHASRLLHYGILSPAEIAARLGHANAGITLSTYSHVIPPD